MSHNTWTHRGVRRLVRPLVATAVTPNQLTVLRLATGIAAAVFMALGEEHWRTVGALVFVFSFILDRADGELARLSGKISKGGHRFDLIADTTSNALIFVGLGIGLRAGPLGNWAILMGLLAGAAVAAVLWLVMRAEASAGPGVAELPTVGGCDADDAMIAVPVAILLGWSGGLLVAAAIGAPVFFIVFLVMMRLGVVVGSPGTGR